MATKDVKVPSRSLSRSAAIAAEGGATGAALRAREHALGLMTVVQDGFNLWCETLEGVFAKTGSYPGVAGDQVDAFMTWLRNERGSTPD